MSMPPLIQDVTEIIENARDVILPRYGASIRRLRGPLAQAMLAILAASESRGKRWITTPQQGKPPRVWREAGLTQRTCQPNRKRRTAWYADCERDNFDPFDAFSNLWGAQKMCARSLSMIVGTVRRAGWNTRTKSLPTADAFMLLYLTHSIGRAGTKRAILRAGQAGLAKTHTPGAAVAQWIDRPAAALMKWGTMPIDLVRLRVARALQLVSRAGETGIPLPTAVDPEAPRPADVLPCPPDLYEHLDELAAAAKAQGPRATGAW